MFIGSWLSEVKGRRRNSGQSNPSRSPSPARTPRWGIQFQTFEAGEDHDVGGWYVGNELATGSSARESHGLFSPCGHRVSTLDTLCVLCCHHSPLLRLTSTSTRSGLPMRATGLSFPRPQS
ncbi:hypothetical protein ASPBRDRAFT_48916 [Aspergillus brasiliensis CBS 101740]|uniref:Uncharacterized protein n=1 Tax=Aspergillus brasiliensis (strain CBS 101740 / IMI 381727 / IBT 21946) TaxID=767769 RepID=A0A1L9U4L7_ASPBC|nr:hypothetical protein ASPBRDRAFT_48916 [Aspergillus brasiliensis CBS 101740]